MYHPSRGGVRGGRDQFNWDDVKADKHRENYLGHSVKAPVGRWQKGKDLMWYARDTKQTAAEAAQSAREEIERVKEEEEAAMREALGLAPRRDTKPWGNRLDKREQEELFKRTKAGEEVDKTYAEGERIQGLGFAPAPKNEAPDKKELLQHEGGSKDGQLAHIVGHSQRTETEKDGRTPVAAVQEQKVPKSSDEDVRKIKRKEEKRLAKDKRREEKKTAKQARRGKGKRRHDSDSSGEELNRISKKSFSHREDSKGREAPPRATYRRDTNTRRGGSDSSNEGRTKHVSNKRSKYSDEDARQSPNVRKVSTRQKAERTRSHEDCGSDEGHAMLDRKKQNSYSDEETRRLDSESLSRLKSQRTSRNAYQRNNGVKDYGELDQNRTYRNSEEDAGQGPSLPNNLIGQDKVQIRKYENDSVKVEKPTSFREEKNWKYDGVQRSISSQRRHHNPDGCEDDIRFQERKIAGGEKYSPRWRQELDIKEEMIWQGNRSSRLQEKKEEYRRGRKYGSSDQGGQAHRREVSLSPIRRRRQDSDTD